MIMRRSYIAFAVLYLLVGFSSCGIVGNDGPIPFPYSESDVRNTIDSVAKEDKGWMYADDYSEPIYFKEKDTLYWVNEWGIDDRADTLLSWLQEVENEGLQRSSFRLDEMEEDLLAFRKLKPDSCEQADVCQLLGRLEYRLTRAYLRFAFGQRYGYTRPNNIFSKLLKDPNTGSFRHIFDHKIDVPTDSFYNVAIEQLVGGKELGEFLKSVQPDNEVHTALQNELKRATEAGEKKRVELCRTNLERARWRYPRPEKTGKYVWVNLASYELQAVDNDKDSTLRMKVCCGNMTHKTPLLTSEISRLELNPYWTVPMSIISHEVAPVHTHDSAYFARNRMKAIDNQTKQEVYAASLSAAQWKSGRYTLRQDRGAGNSLGRLIFRFPNNFSVYLHDTNSPGAFEKTVRAVSHGCVRVQKPLDLAIFLMDNPSPLLIDKVRVAIDKSPLTAEGQTYKTNTNPEKYMQSYAFNPKIPVFLDYYTLYPERDGSLRSYSDSYEYDEPIQKVLNQF